MINHKEIFSVNLGFYLEERSVSEPPFIMFNIGYKLLFFINNFGIKIDPVYNFNSSFL